MPYIFVLESRQIQSPTKIETLFIKIELSEVKENL